MAKSYGATKSELNAARFVTLAAYDGEDSDPKTGVYHDEEGEMVATDGHRLHIASTGGNRSGARYNPLTLYRLGEDFPDWRRVVREPQTTVTVDVRALYGAVAGAVELAKACGSSSRAEVRVEWRPDRHQLSVVASVDSAEGETVTGTILRGEWEGSEPLLLTLNGNYLLEALKPMVVPHEESGSYEPVRLSHEGSFGPCTVDNGHLKAVIMSLRHDDKKGRAVQTELEALGDKLEEFLTGKRVVRLTRSRAKLDLEVDP